MPLQLERVMLADIHGVDPTQFKANLDEHPSYDGSRKKRRKDSAEGTTESVTRIQETMDLSFTTKRRQSTWTFKHD